MVRYLFREWSEADFPKQLIFLVPTRRRGNAVPTRQRRGPQDGTLARPESVPTPARGNQKIIVIPIIGPGLLFMGWGNDG